MYGSTTCFADLPRTVRQHASFPIHVQTSFSMFSFLGPAGSYREPLSLLPPGRDCAAAPTGKVFRVVGACVRAARAREIDSGYQGGFAR